jgi:hypothetical protein
VRGGAIPDAISLPQGDEAVAVTVADNKNPYILTNTHRVVTVKQNTSSYVNTTGESAWDAGNVIDTYNGNLYTVNTAQNQIYRYRPAVNGFSQKANILATPYSGSILDIGIDGGFYMFFSDGKIGRYITTNSDAGVVSLALNKIP